MSGRDKRSLLVVPTALAVMLGWLVALGDAVLTNQFEPLTVVTPVMLLLAGYAFGVKITRGGDDR